MRDGWPGLNYSLTAGWKTHSLRFSNFRKLRILELIGNHSRIYHHNIRLYIQIDTGLDAETSFSLSSWGVAAIYHVCVCVFIL